MAALAVASEVASAVVDASLINLKILLRISKRIFYKLGLQLLGKLLSWPTVDRI